MKGPRGSLSSVLDEGAKIAQGRLEAVAEYCDSIATPDEPSSGGTLSNAQFVALLRGDKDFATQLAEKAAFMSEDERAKLRKTIEGLFPQELPPTVSAIPPQPWEA